MAVTAILAPIDLHSIVSVRGSAFGNGYGQLTGYPPSPYRVHGAAAISSVGDGGQFHQHTIRHCIVGGGQRPEVAALSSVHQMQAGESSRE